MKIFDSYQFGSKVNFVDEKNVLVGYDSGQSCCEHADWFIADAPTTEVYTTPERVFGKTDIDLTNFVFDPSYFVEHQGAFYGEGGIAIFRIHDGGTEKFLHLFNCHNGYYAHGFTMAIGDQGIREGCL